MKDQKARPCEDVGRTLQTEGIAEPRLVGDIGMVYSRADTEWQEHGEAE